jgi:O-antigen/teichoic acid export membrane protein
MYGMAEPVLIAGYVKDNDFDRLCLRTQFLFKANLLILIPILVWLATVGPEITSLMTGGKYAEYAWLLLLVVAQIVVGSQAVTAQLILNAVGQSHILLKSGMVSLLTMAAVLAWVASSGHWIYMVFTPLAYSIANNTFIAWALRRHGYAYRLPWMDMAKIAASGIAAYLVVVPTIAMIHSPLGEVIVAGGIGLVVFLLALYMLAAVGIEDRQIIRSMLRGGTRA